MCANLLVNLRSRSSSVRRGMCGLPITMSTSIVKKALYWLLFFMSAGVLMFSMIVDAVEIAFWPCWMGIMISSFMLARLKKCKVG